MRVLFVEDDVGQIQLFKEAVGEWNGRNDPRAFDVITEPTVADAEKTLEAVRIDAALFDLRLPSRQGQRPGARGGNELAKVTLAQVGVPIAVISGNPNDLDEELAHHQMLERFDKGDVDVYARVLTWLDGLWTMMTVLAATRRRVQASGAEIFAKRLWPRWETYAGLSDPARDELAQIVTRQYVGHIAELLGIDGEDNVPWHPYECYVRPALLEKRPHTGDIYDFDGTLWIVLTPQCDMANGNVTEVLLAEIDQTPPKEWADRLAELAIKDLAEKKVLSRDKFFRDLVNQNIGPSVHFLPPLEQGAPPLMVRFGRLTTRSMTELSERLGDRQASVAAAFLPNLVQRFGAYISRTGQPDIAAQYFQ